MSTPLLAAKLYIPSPRPNVVRRDRLIERLNQGMRSGRRLTLISAPAGFGKTTLVSSWIAVHFDLDASPNEDTIENRNSEFVNQVAWLSLDEGDSDPLRFLTYLGAAIQTVAPTLCEEMLDALHSPQPPPAELVLTTLLNEITTIPNPFVLVLDDYHVIDATSVDTVLTFLLEHLPSQMHLVITTREDPQLPLARLRARGQLTELRAADLRFTLDEATSFIERMVDLDLSVEEVASLETRTEGWIAGLQLAALSMRGREDVHEFIRAFAGTHRYIVDYLVEEVLQHQADHVRNFLLQTSILDRLNGPLCDAVLCRGAEEGGSIGAEGQGSRGAGEPRSKGERPPASGQETLEYLERANLFVVPLDDTRQWFRYHNLFADVLHAHLMEEQPDRIPTLHRRASEWYEHNDMPAEAIRHARAGHDFERAADLIELAWSDMDRSRRSSTWLGWAAALPDEVVRARPVLSVGYAWALLDGGKPEAAEGRLRDAERWLNTASDHASGEMAIADEEEFRSLPATIATARAYQAQALGDVADSVAYARLALDLLPENDHLRRGIAGSLLGLAIWTDDDLEEAHRVFADALAAFERAGNVLFAITGTYILADIRMAQGRLREAIRTYERALQLATEQGGSRLRGTAELHLGLSELLWEQGELDAATQHLHRSEELAEHAALPRWKYRWCRAQARIRAAEGDLEGALDLLDEAERRYIRGPVPDMRPIAALRAQVWIAQGQLADALGWACEQGLSVDDDLTYVREFEYVTLARLLMAQYKRDRADDCIHEALALLERLLHTAEAGRRTGNVIDILVVQALAHHAQGDIPAALVPLQRALTLTEPEGYVRRFVDEGAPMAELLSEAAARGIAPDYTDRLLAAFLTDSATATMHSRIPDPKSQMVEPLSERELEVLHLIAQGFSNREIGARLFIALNTVKGHNRKIFGKLQVKRRTEAVARARELGLL